MASCALPVFCRPVEVGGRRYFDGGVADSLPVGRAMEEGCERVVAVLNRPRGYQKAPERGRLLYPLLLRRYPRAAAALRARHIDYMRSLCALERMEAEGRAVLIRPRKPLPMRTFTRDGLLAEQVCQTGYEDALRALEGKAP
jgi:predicted patatin/cPLA2 family phospholipase